MPRQRPSLADISERAGVSRTTVSLVLNHKAAEHRIADETVERVRAVAADLGYAPNHAARSLRMQRSGLIGLIVPDLTNHFSASLAKALDGCASAAGYQLWIGDSEDDPEREAALIETMQARQVEGLLVASAQASARKGGSCPVVYLDRRVRGAADWVCSDNQQAAQGLIGALCARGVFGADAAWIGGVPTSSSNSQRRAGFDAAMDAAGLASANLPHLERDWSPAWGHEAMAQLADRPRAICCASFTLLQGVLDYWRERGGIDPAWRFATFDDHPLLDHLAQPISAVQQDHQALADAAFTLLEQRIDQAEVATAGITVPALLRIRHT